ncbi:DUF1153 domain-containing protein [Burkholderia sp. SIMBA_062]|uniref:DUF1153 domain-containing protein n=1 Tax=Burkholderia sp. SIMBA_062 TaxID=3085803 RepID=UPI003979592C
MSMKMDENIKRWTAKCKVVSRDIIQVKTTVPEASWAYNLSPFKTENCVKDGKRGMENALRASRPYVQ